MYTITDFIEIDHRGKNMEILSPKQLTCVVHAFQRFITLYFFPNLFSYCYFTEIKAGGRPSYPHIVADPVSFAHLEEDVIVNDGKVFVLNRTAHENVAADQGSLAKEKGERVKAEESLRDSSFETGVQIYTRVAKS